MSNPLGLPYTPALAVGPDWVLVSGQIGLGPDGLPDEFGAEVDAVLANLRDRLAEHGLGLEHVVKTTCFLTDLGRFDEFNARYAAAFTAEPRPARSTVQVAALPIGATVEVEAWAYRSAR